MIWIKASERVPDHYRLVHLQYNNADKIASKATARYNPSMGHWITLSEFELKGCTDIEWLDESSGEELKEGGGMKTKEEILREKLTSICDKEYAVLSAMDECATQFAGTREEWISVEERMPEHNLGVLVFIPAEDNHITSGMWDISDEWVLLDEYRSPQGEVTHWRPLPNPPNTNILKPI